MKSKKLYVPITIAQLKNRINEFKDDCEVDFFHVQVSREHSTCEIFSQRKDGK